MRQSQSCDACRARKVRCSKDNPQDQKAPCKHCLTLGIACTYEYQPKKRGPPNLYLRRLQQAAAVKQKNQGQDQSPSEHHDPGSADGNTSITHLGPNAALGMVSTNVLKAPFLDPSISFSRSMLSLASPYPTSVNTFQTRFQQPKPATSSVYNGSSSRSIGTHVQANVAVGQCYPSTSTAIDAYHHDHGWPYQHQVFRGSVPTNVPPLEYHCQPRRLNEIAPRGTISLIIALFFDFIYPLRPCIHKPSFLADLHAYREEQDPLFFALVMSIVASTLVQVPQSYIPMDRTAVRKLAKTAFESSRHITVGTYDPPTSMHVIIRYFDSIYHFYEGRDATQHAAFGEAVHIAVVLRLHEESSYENLDPVESEVRRRIFWLLFGADKSTSFLLGRPMILRDEDCTVYFPKEIDDEYITPGTYLSQPLEKTAVVTGLNGISRVFSILGDILTRIRVDKRSPPRGQYLTARLDDVQSLHNRILTVLSNAPEPLRLKPTSKLQMPQAFGGPGFHQAMLTEVKEFFDNPNASRANALDPFLVMQANLYVTQQLARFVIEQYRDELLVSLQGEVNEQEVQQQRENIACDLLNILHSVPIQSIATNGLSLVHKARFVASTLLGAVKKAETAPVPATRAHASLWNLLNILSEIERNYILNDGSEIL